MIRCIAAEMWNVQLQHATWQRNNQQVQCNIIVWHYCDNKQVDEFSHKLFENQWLNKSAITKIAFVKCQIAGTISKWRKNEWSHNNFNQNNQQTRNHSTCVFNIALLNLFVNDNFMLEPCSVNRQPGYRARKGTTCACFTLTGFMAAAKKAASAKFRIAAKAGRAKVATEIVW